MLGGNSYIDLEAICVKLMSRRRKIYTSTVRKHGDGKKAHPDKREPTPVTGSESRRMEML